MPAPDGHSLVKNKSKKWQKELISIILCAPSRRLKWWSGKHSSHCMVFVLWRTVFIVFCNAAAAMQITIIPPLVTCYLFFRCGIEKESLSWAFPQHSPTLAHTIFYSHISFLKYRHDSRTHIYDVWVEYILRDVVYPSCLTWFQSGGGTRLSFSCTLHGKAWKLCKANAAHTQLYKHLMDSSGHAYARWLCKDLGHFTLVQFHNHYLLTEIYKVSQES